MVTQNQPARKLGLVPLTNTLHSHSVQKANGYQDAKYVL